MKLNSTTKMSILCSLIGIALLYAGALEMRPGLTPISRIDEDFVGVKTKISGRIIELQKHPKGHLFLKVKDSSGGTISVPIFARTNSKMDERIELLDNIQVTGKVEKYQEELELLPEKVESIRIIHSPPLEISKIDNQRIGETVKLRGVVRKKNSVGNGGLLMELWKNGSKLTIYVPSNVVNNAGFPELNKGDKIQAAGTVQLYEKELELKVSNSHNVRLLGAS